MFVWVVMTVVMVGWDYMGPSPGRHRHLFARSEFHKTCAGIVDVIMAGSFAIRHQKRFYKKSASVIVIRPPAPCVL
jgi:hypothetical protein